jgi:hypothetical protein
MGARRGTVQQVVDRYGDPVLDRYRVLVGIDLLDLVAAPAAEPLAGRILSRAERSATAGDATAVHAHLALKEAMVKAVGGRPPGFRWHGATVDGTVPRHRCPVFLAHLVRDAGHAETPPTFVHCRLDAGLSSWARSALAVDGAVELRCTGAWTMSGADELFAVVAIQPRG